MTNAKFVERVFCPSCRGSNVVSIHRTPFLAPNLWAFVTAYYPQASNRRDWFTDADYELMNCSDCTLLYQRFIGGEELLTELYDRWLNGVVDSASQKNIDVALAHPAQSRDGIELGVVGCHFGRCPQALRVLDWGMGRGLWVRIAHSLGFDTWGYDLSEQRCDSAKALGIHILREEQLGGFGADFINADQVLEHVPDPLDTLAKLATALSSQGVLKVSVPNAAGLGNRLGRHSWNEPRRLNAVHPLEHINGFTEKALIVAAAKSGLSVIRPSWRCQFEALAKARIRDPKLLAKEFARPVVRRAGYRGLYLWFTRS